jgi:hypothetical protein
MNFQANMIKRVFLPNGQMTDVRNQQELDNVLAGNGVKLGDPGVRVWSVAVEVEPRFVDCSANPELLVHAKVGVRQDAKSAGPLLFTVG